MLAPVALCPDSLLAEILVAATGKLMKDPDARAAAADHEPAIGIGPVKIPEYLDRPQMVARPSDSGPQYPEVDKWAESLEKNLTRVLTVNLSVLVPPERVFIYP